MVKMALCIAQFKGFVVQQSLKLKIENIPVGVKWNAQCSAKEAFEQHYYSTLDRAEGQARDKEHLTVKSTVDRQLICLYFHKSQPCISQVEFKFRFDFLKSLIMKTILCRKVLAILLCVAIILFSACNNKQKEQQQTSASATASEHPHADSVLKDNEVKSEAPDAGSKTEQGYALPRQGDQMAQSPVNIISDKTEKDPKQQFSFAFHSDCDAVENLGHTIQVDFKKGSTCAINGKDYTSKQFHFHTPSEHLIDGVTYPLEMHIVNVLTDSSHPDKPSYIVLSVMFKMGAENKFLKEFLNDIPNEEGEKHALQGGEVKLDDLLSQFAESELKSYYTYNGSLTTPPFTEAVQWVILKHVPEASEEQIMKIEKMEGNNARHVQAVNNRKIFSH